MRLPFDFLPHALASRFPSIPGLLLLGLLTLALGDPMRAHSDALISPAAPFGILSLQFACSIDAAQAILSAWDSPALQHARLSLYWDMGFAPAYGLALAAVTQRYFAYRSHCGKSAFAIIAWLPIWAAMADWLENLFHLWLIATHTSAALAIPAPLACAAALFKWSLLAGWLLGMGWTTLQGLKPASDADRSD